MPLFSHHFSEMVGITAFIAILQIKVLQNVLQIEMLWHIIVLGKGEQMYESFEFDLDQASFEWDKKSESISSSTASISKQPPVFSLIPIS